MQETFAKLKKTLASSETLQKRIDRKRQLRRSREHKQTDTKM